jgi:hypothetical protein
MDVYTSRGKKRWPTEGARALKTARLLWNRPGEPPSTVAACFDYLQMVAYADGEWDHFSDGDRARANAALVAFTPTCMAPMFEHGGPHTEDTNIGAFRQDCHQAILKLEEEPESVCTFCEEPQETQGLQAYVDTFGATDVGSQGLQAYVEQEGRK